MVNKTTQMTKSAHMTYADFEHLLAVYGSDRARWPVEARKEAAKLVAMNVQARQLLAEMEALDRVLDRAPLPSLEREAALTARIMDAAQRTPRVVATRPGQDVRATAALAPRAAVDGRTPLTSRLRLAGTRAGLGAMISAASLVAGILIGLTNSGPTWFRPVQQISAALTGGSVMSQASYDPLDEDTL